MMRVRKLPGALRLRTSVILLLVCTVLATMALVGSGILAVMTVRIAAESDAHAARSVEALAGRVETFLHDIQARVELAGAIFETTPENALRVWLDVARRPTLSAIYMIDADGRLVAASVEGANAARTRDLVGIDLSAHPYFKAALDSPRAIWSDKHISAVTGAVVIGIAAPVGDRAGVVIAEISLGTLLAISQLTRTGGGLDYWIVDRRGEVVADTAGPRTQNVNLANLPIVTAGFAGAPLPTTMSYGGTDYHVSASLSKALGWLFVTRVPAGFANAHLREVAAIVAVAFIGSVAVGLLLAPLWAQWIVRPLRAVADRAHAIAGGARPTAWPESRIAELNRLSADLGFMVAALSAREEDLRRLNEDLEGRVAERTEALTRSNHELTNALREVERARDELIQSEKHAALGRLVAGLSHEMNTPLGNGLLAVTALEERLARFEANLEGGLRRSELDAFVGGVRESIGIAERNLAKASELMGSLKQVAADRTASRRRRFQLGEVIDEVLLTLSPSIRRRPVDLRLDLAENGEIWLDSYPGELGQALTNLIENCLAHAFGDETRGRVDIAARIVPPDRLSIRLSDDGRGMTEDEMRRAFDPFFTTTLGRGGTGLGLYITRNSVANVLGGTISVESAPGKGSTFEILIPLSAPPHELGGVAEAEARAGE